MNEFTIACSEEQKRFYNFQSFLSFSLISDSYIQAKMAFYQIIIPIWSKLFPIPVPMLAYDQIHEFSLDLFFIFFIGNLKIPAEYLQYLFKIDLD